MNNQLKEKIRAGIYNILQDSLRQAAKEYHQELLGNIVHSIYDAPASPYYDRNQGFLKSVSQGFDLTIDANGDFELHFTDDKLIKASNGAKRKFGHHKSFPWNDPYPSNAEVRESLFDWLNEGFTILGKRFHEGYNFDIPEEEFWDRFIGLSIERINNFLLEITKRGG